MASDTDTKKTAKAESSRDLWHLQNLRATSVMTSDNVDRLLDIYWGGSERRLTYTAVKIIGINMISVLILLVGVLYISQYQNTLIANKLHSFSIEVNLIADAINSIATQKNALDKEPIDAYLKKISSLIPHRVKVFDSNGDLITDNTYIIEKTKNSYLPDIKENRYKSLLLLRDMLKFLINIVPTKNKLPHYTDPEKKQLAYYPEFKEAQKGLFVLNISSQINDRLLLTGARSLDNTSTHAEPIILVSRDAYDINLEIGDLWMSVLGAFTLSLILTIFISIYISGIVTSPLKKLAKAAEGIRKGTATYQDIPDYSDRGDEIGELSLALRNMTISLEKRLGNMERFAADVSHELKNPLTSLKSAIETASIVRKESDRKKLMDIVHEDIHRLDKLITDISSASRLDTALSQDKFGPVRILSMLKELLNTYQNPLDRAKTTSTNHVTTEQGVAIEIKTYLKSTDSPLVYGKAERLEQVFRNLINNALGFVPEKDGLISIELHNDGSRYLRIYVIDNGSGIPKKKLGTIFERFYTERQENAKQHHSGLGLSICKQIIEAMSGKIFAENHYRANGRIAGAKFTIILNKMGSGTS